MSIRQSESEVSKNVSKAVSPCDLQLEKTEERTLNKQKEVPGVTIQFRVRYYETDAMGIVHHSNYMRWFELGRTEYLRTVGLPYRALEERGIGSPVIGIRAAYKKPAQYDDLITLKTWVQAYNGIRLTMAYAVTCGSCLLCTGESDHAFVRDGRAVAPVRSLPDVHDVMQLCLSSDKSLAANKTGKA